MGCSTSMVFNANGAASFPESLRIHTLEVSLSLMVTSAPLWLLPMTVSISNSPNLSFKSTIAGRSSMSIRLGMYLLGLRLKRKVDARYDIGREEYHYLMMQLLERENPALHARLEQCELDKKKWTLCCMIALGLDDIDMMAEAVCLSTYTVNDYCKEFRGVVEALRG